MLDNISHNQGQVVFMEGSTKCLLQLYIICINYKDGVVGGCINNLLLVPVFSAFKILNFVHVPLRFKLDHQGWKMASFHTGLFSPLSLMWGLTHLHPYPPERTVLF